MNNLQPIEGTELNEYVINLLHKQNICTVIEFLNLDEDKLCKITNLPESQINSLKARLRRVYGPQLVTALHYCTPAWRNIFNTGIPSLDSLIGDELRPGRIYEICGYSASGKTMLCTTITINFVQNHSAEVLYIDTKRDFSGTQMKRMLTARGVPKTEVGRTLQMIKVERCYSLRVVISVLESLLDHLRRKEVAFKLVIIDSLPSVWYLFHGEDGSKIGKSLLTKCANLLKQLAKEHQLLVLCVNVMVRNISEQDTQSNLDIEDRTDWPDRQQRSEQFVAPSSKPSLGKCWEGVPTIRLTIEDPFYEAIINEVSVNQAVGVQKQPLEGMNRNQRVVRVIKSCFSPTGVKCVVSVNDTGVY